MQLVRLSFLIEYFDETWSKEDSLYHDAVDWYTYGFSQYDQKESTVTEGAYR